MLRSIWELIANSVEHSAASRRSRNKARSRSRRLRIESLELRRVLAASPVSIEQWMDDAAILDEPQQVAAGLWFLGSGPAPQDLRILTTANVNAADTTNTDQLQPGGSSGLNLTGSGLTVGVWDEARVRTTHQEFGGRVTIGDGTTSNSDHATHVAGTIGASGVNAAARGMASSVSIRSFDWNSDFTEMGANAGTLVASNHSYGYLTGWTGYNWGSGTEDTWFADRSIYSVEDPAFGKYSSEARTLDQTLAANPNLLSVWAAGNDRGNSYLNRRGDGTYVTYFSTPPASGSTVAAGWYRVSTANYPAPGADGNNGTGYDSIEGTKMAKNSLVIGAVNDATADPIVAASVTTASFSGYGPTDDGRIKPDLVANGVSLFSTTSSSDTAYGSSSGTSMAAPNATGTAALLIEHYRNLYGSLPSAAITKGVLIHNALDVALTGPDYATGWGLIDAAKSAQFLANAKAGGAGSTLLSETFAGRTKTYTFTSDGSGSLKATIVWTDVAGATAGGGVDFNTKALVNDLNLSIQGPGGTFLPWTLNPATPNGAAVRTAANTVDNVEQVLIDAPTAGTYTVTVSGPAATTQAFAMTISGTAIAAPSPTVSISVAPSAVAENGAANLIYTVSRGAASSSSLTVSFDLNGTAGTSGDYTVIGAATYNATDGTGTIVIPSGASNATFQVDPSSDATIEADETVDAFLVSGAGYLVGAPANAVGTIQNDDLPAVSISVAPSSAAEDSTTKFGYFIARSVTVASPMTVSFVIEGTSTADDYTVTDFATYDPATRSGTIVIPAGVSGKKLFVDPNADSTSEADETAIVRLTSGSGYSLGVTYQATATILNDDAASGAVVTVSASPASLAENAPGSIAFAFQRTGATTAPLTVSFDLNGSASTSADYTVLGAATYNSADGTGTIVIPANSSSAVLSIDPTDESIVEPDETVDALITPAGGYSVGSPNSASASILNDDVPAVSVSVSPSNVTENGAANLLFTFTRSQVTASPLTVSFDLDGSASTSADYTVLGAATYNSVNGIGTIVIPANAASVVLTIDPTDDSSVEGEENVLAQILAAAGYSIVSPGTASGSILDDDVSSPPTVDVSVSVAPASVNEDGAANLVYTFARSAASSSPLTVRFDLNGTAGTSGDYTVLGAASYNSADGTGTIVIPAGATTANLTVDPTSDTAIESNETVEATIVADAAYNVVAPGLASGTIVTDDLPTASVSASSPVAENGATNLFFFVARTGATTAAITIHFKLEGIASSLNDYVPIGHSTFDPVTGIGSIVIPVGASGKKLFIDPTGDSSIEPDETVIFRILPDAAYLNGASAQATGVILNDDA